MNFRRPNTQAPWCRSRATRWKRRERSVQVWGGRPRPPRLTLRKVWISRTPAASAAACASPARQCRGKDETESLQGRHRQHHKIMSVPQRNITANEADALEHAPGRERANIEGWIPQL